MAPVATCDFVPQTASQRACYAALRRRVDKTTKRKSRLRPNQASLDPEIEGFFKGLPQTFVVCDAPRQTGPRTGQQRGPAITVASSGFYELTQFTKPAVLGRNCNFLQGSRTSATTIDFIRQALRRGNGCSCRILNYKADGTPFWNQLHVHPIHNRSGVVQLYVGCQVTSLPASLSGL